MKRQTTNPNSLLLLSLLVGALMLSGCGSRTMGSLGSSDDFASRSPVSTGANCNSFSASQAQLSGKLQVYVNPLGTVVSDLIRLKITGITSNFASNYLLKLYRWKAYSSNATDIDQNPLTFSIWYQGRQVSNYLTQLTVADINTVKQQNFITANSLAEFFQQTEIYVNDLDLSWDALKVAMYSFSGSQSTVVAAVDTLIPSFAANPNDYAKDHPPVLQQLHPFWLDRTTNIDFAAAAQSFCF
jgi:hypothetical protein